MSKTVLILTGRVALYACLVLCPAVLWWVACKAWSASLGSYLGLPFLTSNLLLSILSPRLPPHTTAHARAHRCTCSHSHPVSHPGPLPRMHVFTLTSRLSPGSPPTDACVHTHIPSLTWVPSHGCTCLLHSHPISHLGPLPRMYLFTLTSRLSPGSLSRLSSCGQIFLQNALRRPFSLSCASSYLFHQRCPQHTFKWNLSGPCL